MSKQTTSLPLALDPAPPGVPRHRWLYETLRAAILDGRLEPLARLPATRDLAHALAVSRGTVLAAFDRLRAEGYVESRVGDGTYVRRVAGAERTGGKAAESAPAPPRLSAYARQAEGFTGLPSGSARAFRVAQPALDAFPGTLWARVAARRIRRGSGNFLGNGDVAGYAPLRQALAEYLRTMRGVRCTADQVIVTSGAQEGIDLALRVLIDPGDPVWMEDPGYAGTTRALRAAGARVLHAPVDARGLDVEGAARELGPARLAYVTPANQFPLGMAMDAARRLELLRWARECGAAIIEDDYDSEFRYTGQPIPALQGLDADGRVVFVGTLNKVLFPALRLGYLVVPDALVDAFLAVKSLTTRFGPGLAQVVMCDFMDAGHFGRHVRRMRELYAARLAALRACVARDLGGLVELRNTDAGMHTVGWLPRDVDDVAAASAGQAWGLETVEVSRFRGARPLEPGLILGFAAIDEAEIARGTENLARALAAVRDTARAPES
jgi:GntR family transcriptional regulator / MocR family aminotransferase